MTMTRRDYSLNFEIQVSALDSEKDLIGFEVYPNILRSHISGVETIYKGIIRAETSNEQAAKLEALRLYLKKCTSRADFDPDAMQSK